MMVENASTWRRGVLKLHRRAVYRYIDVAERGRGNKSDKQEESIDSGKW